MKTIKFHAAILTVLASLAVTAQAATCPGNLGASSTPTADFTVNANGTVTQTTTGLMWKQCNEGLSGANCATGTVTYLTWSDALLAARNSTFAGYTDWRLPNKQELESLVDDSCFAAINDTVFPNTVADWTWTSTTLAAGPASAWIVFFGHGDSNASNKAGDDVAVRFVRGGQSFDALAAVAMQTLTFSAAPTGVVVGSTPTVTATSASPNSGNPIVYSSTTPSICTVNSSTGVVTAIAVGTCIIAANQAGNASYAAAAQVTQSFAVGLAAQTITFGTAPTGVVVGGTPTVTASSASPNSGNPIVYSSTTASVCTVNSSTGVVTAIAVGTCTIAANQAGNTNYTAAAQVTQSFAVGLAAQTITVVPPPSSVLAGTSVALSGSSSAGLPVSYTSQTPLVCSVSGSTVTTLAAGTCIIAANQSGNSSTAAAPQVTVQFTVAAAVAPAVAVPALGGWALGLLGWLLVGVVAARRKVRQG